jgi:hypothetical protein
LKLYNDSCKKRDNFLWKIIYQMECFAFGLDFVPIHVFYQGAIRVANKPKYQ